MLRTIIVYGIALAALTGVLRFIEYRYFVRDLSLEIYISIIATFFTGVGVWAGLKLTRKKVVLTNPNFQLNDKDLEGLGISKREYEVLQHIAEGLSNREIAEKLFVSLNTIKSHSSNLFMKLNARNRTQAVLRAKEHQILP